jgi:hypothetical protein
VLYPDFEPRVLPSGKVREADVELSDDKQWVKAGGGTSLFDRPGVFKSRGWVIFQIPTGTLVPESPCLKLAAVHWSFSSSCSTRRSGR